MSIISKILLYFSFILLFINGSSFTFIFLNERMDSFFAITLFIFTSLLGMLLASIADENDKQTSFYCKLSMYSNFVIALSPMYYHFFANKIIPSFL